MELEPITDWLWCLRTPLVQAYAVREGGGFDLIDTSTAGQDRAILEALGTVAIGDILLTHGHDDHTGSAAALAERAADRRRWHAAQARRRHPLRRPLSGSGHEPVRVRPTVRDCPM